MRPRRESAHYASALVTGASSGIGAEFARALAAQGCRLVLVARRADRLAALATELDHVEVTVLPADLTTDEGLATVERHLAAQPVELLINNAGVAGTGDFGGAPIERLDEIVRLNVLALMRLTHAAIPAMIEAGHGGVINVSSLASDQPLRGLATYSASKAFVTSFSESLAAEVRGAGVHVTVLKPGLTWTEMNPDGPDPESRAGRFWLRADDVARAALAAVEAGRLICVPGLHWRAANSLVNALPHQLVRSLTTRFDATS